MTSKDMRATAVEAVRLEGAEAERRLAQEVYPQLRRMARQRLRQHQPLTLLDTTALVHESWLRMAGSVALEGVDRAHFLAYAARTMRSIIVDHARARLSQKRGEGVDELPLDDEALPLPAPQVPQDVLRLHDALQDLSRLQPALTQLVELRYFAGLTEAEVAELSGRPLRSVQRDWAKARALLLELMS